MQVPFAIEVKRLLCCCVADTRQHFCSDVTNFWSECVFPLRSQNGGRKMGKNLKPLCVKCGSPIPALGDVLRAPGLFCDDACEQSKADDDTWEVLNWLLSGDAPAVARAGLASRPDRPQLVHIRFCERIAFLIHSTAYSLHTR